MSPMPRPLTDYLRQVVGDCAKVEVVPVQGNSEVVEAVDADGARWFGKRVATDAQWRSEVRAYRRWVPALGNRAPSLRAAHRPSRSFVISAVPGEHRDALDPSVHRAAGALLRRFHESHPPRPTPQQFPEQLVQRLERWLDRGQDMFTEVEVSLARHQTRLLADLPSPTQIPCHGDYKPHNWLVDDQGIVRIIDFAESRWHVPAYDLGRLYYGPWWGQPRLADAFLDGYGRRLSELEREFIQLSGLANAMVSAIWCRLHGQPGVEAQARERVAAMMDGHAFDDAGAARRRKGRLRARLFPRR